MGWFLFGLLLIGGFAGAITTIWVIGNFIWGMSK